MLSNQDPGHLRRVKKVAYQLNLPEEVIEDTLYYMSEYIKNKIGKVEVSIEDMMTQEEFQDKLPIVKIPHLGYLKPNYYKYKALHKKAKQAREKKNKNK